MTDSRGSGNSGILVSSVDGGSSEGLVLSESRSRNLVSVGGSVELLLTNIGSSESRIAGGNLRGFVLDGLDFGLCFNVLDLGLYISHDRDLRSRSRDDLELRLLRFEDGNLRGSVGQGLDWGHGLVEQANLRCRVVEKADLGGSRMYDAQTWLRGFNNVHLRVLLDVLNLRLSNAHLNSGSLLNGYAGSVLSHRDRAGRITESGGFGESRSVDSVSVGSGRSRN